MAHGNERIKIREKDQGQGVVMIKKMGFYQSLRNLIKQEISGFRSTSNLSKFYNNSELQHSDHIQEHWNYWNRKEINVT